MSNIGEIKDWKALLLYIREQYPNLTAEQTADMMDISWGSYASINRNERPGQRNLLKIQSFLSRNFGISLESFGTRVKLTSTIKDGNLPPSLSPQETIDYLIGLLKQKDDELEKLKAKV